MERKLKTEKIYRILIKPDQEIEDEADERILQSLNEFDHSGNMTMEITYNADESINEKNEYHYDDSGRVIRSVIYSEDNEALETRKYYYDDAGKTLKEEVLYMDGSVDTIDYHYEDDLLKKKILSTDDGEIEGKEIYQYEEDRMTLYEKYEDDNRLVHQVKNVYKDGVIQESRTWESVNDMTSRQIIYFNEHGRRKEELRYDHNERLTGRHQFEEDDQGRILKVMEESTRGKYSTEYSYDQQGRQFTKTETDMNGQMVSKIERSYNDEGRLKSGEISYRDRMTGTIQKYRIIYEYDYYD